MKKRSLVGLKSQCGSCGKTFVIRYEDKVMYCTDECEKEHDLFKRSYKDGKKVS